MKYLSFVPAATLAALCVSAHAQDGSGSSKKERANTPKKDVIEEVLIQATQREKAEPSLLTEKLSNTAGTLGDPIRGIFALPGIIQADEESGEPSVRGSGPHENEFIVDFLPTGYIFHLFGNSIFDENLLHDFGIQAAGFGADYGYATGAVFDVSLRDPRAQPIRPIVDLSFLQAGAMVEGEIADSHTFYASYRNSLIHMFVSDEGDNEDGIVVNKQPVSKDYQFKYLWRPGNHHRLSWTVIGASDAAAETITAKAQEAILDPGGIGRQSVDSSFVSSGLVWDWDGVDWTTKTGLGYLKEQFKDRLGKSEQQTFTVEQLTLRAEATRRMAKHKFKLGTELRQNDITYDVLMRQENCSDFDPGCEFKRGPLTASKGNFSLSQQAFYVEDLWQATERLQIIPGIRYTRDEYLKQNFVEPRLKLNYEVSPSLSLNSALGRYHQQPHPSEIIPVFGNPRLRSPTSDHIVLGFDKALSNSWSVSVDTYYKRFDNLVTGAPGNSNLNFINGADGSAYGLELMVNKERTDRWYGWLSVSASKTERTIKSTGVTSPYFTDAPLVVNLVGNYQLTPIWNIGVRWTYRSGLPYTPITGNRPNPDFPGRFLPVFGALNSLRADAYHRLDIRAERPFSTSWASGTFFIDMINAYNRKNFRSLEYEPVGLTGSNFRLVREPGLELFPSIGVKLEF